MVIFIKRLPQHLHMGTPPKLKLGRTNHESFLLMPKELHSESAGFLPFHLDLVFPDAVGNGLAVLIRVP